MGAPIKYITGIRRYIRNKLKVENKFNKKKKNSFKIDTLEPRILLSADPVLGAMLAVIIEETVKENTDISPQSQELLSVQNDTAQENTNTNSNIIEL